MELTVSNFLTFARLRSAFSLCTHKASQQLGRPGNRWQPIVENHASSISTTCSKLPHETVCDMARRKALLHEEMENLKRRRAELKRESKQAERPESSRDSSSAISGSRTIRCKCSASFTVQHKAKPRKDPVKDHKESVEKEKTDFECSLPDPASSFQVLQAHT